MEDSARQDCPQPRGNTTSRAPVAATGRLAIEREILRTSRFSNKVISVIQASRRPSTTRIYEATWSRFSSWCRKSHILARSASLPDVLNFLLSGFERGLTANTLRRQVAALATVLHGEGHISLSQHPKVRSFLRGVANLRPPPVHRYPSWDLPLVLQALTSAPFEPLGSASLRILTFKVAFLIAITSARRISELAALSVRRDLCIFHSDRVVLRLDPTFVPKVNSWFHRAQEVVLPNFCPDPTHPRERRWHTLDVRRALRKYIDRTAAFRKSESLFISFQPTTMGKKVTPSTIARWIKACIAMAYEHQATPLPRNITAHSTRSAATTAAWSTQASILEICRAATWASPTTFIRNYKLDVFASAEASFGRRVLQQVLPGERLLDRSDSRPRDT